MSDDEQFHTESLKRATDLRYPRVFDGDGINASEGDPLRATNEGLFASKIPVVGTSRVSLIVCGVSLLVVLALVIYGVVARGQGTKTGAADSVRLECLIARLQNGPRA